MPERDLLNGQSVSRGERSQHELSTDAALCSRMASFVERVYLALESDSQAFDGRGHVLWAMVLEARGEHDDA